MMKSTQNMFWSDINDITRFSENTKANKQKEARKTSSIILATVQLMENFIKGIKQMYGKTFHGELAYFHYGLCIGKRDKKVLIVPMHTGKDIFNSSYHPINNPSSDKKYRQGLQAEGFQKNCVLLMNDIKFISAGRIEKECVSVNEATIKSIQIQVFQVVFQELYTKFLSQQKNIEKYTKQLADQRELIQKLKSENNTYKQKLNNLNKK